LCLVRSRTKAMEFSLVFSLTETNKLITVFQFKENEMVEERTT
jgi:hypothetical protein